MGFNIWEWVWGALIGILVGVFFGDFSDVLRDRFGKWWFIVSFMICLVLIIIVNVVGHLAFK